ncbi:hypothetical protein CSB08_00540 [Candidatus Gracilibacteria bacterium]|nr:MAG: hypothetical protein CSB08_00540 [Candidatus Gracilibacteria bacterium]PIE85328.1 MAG: hypothetical protein CSA08_02895 [Candidatus Gracilibacteria bacterium]
MKYILAFLIFFLPFHALIITFLKCKLGIETDYLRFWKEIIIVFLLFFSLISVLQKNKFSISKIYKNNNLLGWVTAFIICSFIFIFFPFFNLKLSAFLGFKYDVFFFFALIIGLFLTQFKNNLDFLLKTLFVSIAVILVIFLPWYIFGDISALSSIFGYSDKVSTYEVNKCISFAQNVDGQHRFQGTFGGPIRFSVFLTIFYLIYLGFIFDKIRVKSFLNKVKYDKSIKSYLLLILPSIFIITSIFFSYSKTSLLGLVFGITLFIYLVRKFIYKKKITKKFVGKAFLISFIPLFLIFVFKRDLFLHLGAVLNRFDNLSKSVEMFFYNPIGYGLGIAGPATQMGRSIESAGNWQLATSSQVEIHKFLPENWYVQILLEQGIFGIILFIGVLLIIGFRLWEKIKYKRDFFSIGVFSAFITICFMANFTHVFEESATSYILMLIIGSVLAVKNK